MNAIGVFEVGSTLGTWQRVWTDEQPFIDRQTGEFAYHEGHGHFHLKAFEQYRLLDLDGEDQWIDITGVSAGDYQIEIVVDPDELLVEADESNNRATFPLTLDAEELMP